jgi:hypothetical protein
MAIDEFQTSLDLYKAATGWMTTYWQFFSGVTLAVVGLVFGGKVSLPGRGKAILAMAYLLFALTNNWALGKAVRLRSAAREVVVASVDTTQAIGPGALPNRFGKLITQLDPSPASSVQTYQGALTFIVLAGIVAHHWYERREKRREGTSDRSATGSL